MGQDVDEYPGNLTRMRTTAMKVTVAIIIFVLAMLIVGAYLHYIYLPAVKVRVGVGIAPAAVIPVPNPNAITKVPVTVLPSGFPTNIPFYGASGVVDNYTAVSPAGTAQASRTYLSTDSASATLGEYRSYFMAAKNGWTLLAALTSDPNHPALFAKNESGILNINIATQGTGSVVALSFVTPR
jgi:hypothetical protein